MEIYFSQLDETKKILPIIKQYNIGLEVVQFASPYILDEMQRHVVEYKEEIKDIINNTNLSIHGPYADLIPGTRDKEIAKVTNKRLQQGYDVAKKLNAKKIIYHNSYTPKTYTHKEWINNSKRFWENFTNDKLDDIKIHIENTMEHDYFLIKELIDEINHPNFSVCLDIGHVNVYSNMNIQQWIDGLGDRIGHMHIHNNFADKDNHRGINKGNIEIIELLQNINENMKDTTVSLEVVDINELMESLEILEVKNLLSKRMD